MHRARAASRRLAGIIAVVACAASGNGCEGDPVPRDPRLVVLYATCSLNKDHLSPYDPARNSTPNIERFSRESAVLARHHTEAGQSGVAYASLFTGLHADAHGVYYHPVPLDLELDLIGEHFTRGGFESHAWLEHPNAEPELDFAQGVPSENQYPGMLLGHSPEFVELLEGLRADPERRAFVVTTFSRTHGNYKGHQLASFCERHVERCAARARPDFELLRKFYWRHHIDLAMDFQGTVRRLKISPWQQRQLESVVALLYEADVANLDALFGGVVDAIREHGLLDDSIVAFTLDHGEIGIRDNAIARWTHGMQLAPEVLNVAMLIRAPGSGVVPGRYEGVSRSIDVLPTLAGLAGLSPVEGTAGVDLSPALRGEVDLPDLVAWSHTALLPPGFRKQRLHRYPALRARFPDLHPERSWISARRGDEFFELRLDDGSTEHRAYLYRLDRDPEKREDLFDPENPEHASMEAELRRYRLRLIDAFVPPEPEDEQERARNEERLRSLGYIE